MRSRACRRCKQKKLRCNAERPCQPCKLSTSECQSQMSSTLMRRDVTLAPRQRDGTTAMLHEISAIELGQDLLGPNSASKYSSSAIPGGNVDASDPSRHDWRSFFPYLVPANDILEAIFNQYFTLVNWFMLVVDEEDFRHKTSEIFHTDGASRPSFNFCMLMSTVWSITAHYLRRSTYTLVDPEVLKSLCESSLQHLERVFLRITSAPDMEAVQIGILYGSYNLFNGVPNLGFAVLGSTVKIAQVIGLHRESLLQKSKLQDLECCRRVWLALEVFDKYAAVAFGRPATIDDSDCDVNCINDMKDIIVDSETRITFSTYHRYKFQLYRTMGPFLGRRKAAGITTGLTDIRSRLSQAYKHVPLALQYQHDIGIKDDRLLIVQMQAIALALAYDNLQLVLHRHLLFRAQRSHLSTEDNEEVVKQLLESSLRTASLCCNPITQSIYVATHAAMHLGMCALSAGTVICALLLDQAPLPMRTEALTGVHHIINLFSRHFVGHSYKLAEQAVEILEALCQKIEMVNSQHESSQNGVNKSVRRTTDDTHNWGAMGAEQAIKEDYRRGEAIVAVDEDGSVHLPELALSQIHDMIC